MSYYSACDYVKGLLENASAKPNGIVDKNRGQRPDYFGK